jgi:hypothetical protein
MKIYRIRRNTRGIVHCTVRYTEGQGEGGWVYRLPHANLHSPTGFECGYGGSGPADLAASILADWFMVKARTVAAVYRGRPLRRPRRDKPTVALAEHVVHLHQDFKAEVIARLLIAPGESLEITGDQIAEWLVKHERRESQKAANA